MIGTPKGQVMDGVHVPNSGNTFSTFGDLLKYLRRRAHLTQLELSIAVGYSEAQISRLEQNQRLPDPTAVQALFIPALHLENEPQLSTHLLELAQSARQEDAPAAGLPPYRGLLFFEETDAELFFGREALTAHLLGHVMALARDASTRFLTVVGASGSGKSSLVRAGLAVALKRVGWDVRLFTPTSIPLWTLEKNLNTKNLPEKERVLILVDQFEEVFTLCRDEMERIRFMERLISLSQDTSRRNTVVIALRADFYSHCAQYPLLRQVVAEEQEYIGQMTAGELRCAIEEPAKRGGWELETGLVDILLQDVGAQGSYEPEPGALPLLSHALLATWQRRRGRTLTLQGYRVSGEVRGAIAETAESVFTDQLNQAQQELARNVFLRLTELGESTEATRRRATLSELVRHPSEAVELRAVLNILAEARLITLNENSAEVAHEALIREWGRLRFWLAQDREGLLLHRHLTESTHEWEVRGRDPADLYRGGRLAQVREWAAGNKDRLNIAEQAFLAASIEREEQDAREREAQHERELAAAQSLADMQSQVAKQLQRRALLLAVALSLSMVLAVTAMYYWKQAQSRELAAASVTNLADDPERSILLAIQAIKTAHTVEAENALHRSILESRVRLVLHHDAEVWSVTFSSDGRRIGTASQDKTAKVWDANNGKLLLTLSGHTASVNSIAFSPDGKRVATSSDDHTAKVWDAATGKELFTLFGHTDQVYRIAFSPDGTRLATASNDRTAKIWDAGSGRELFSLTGHGDPVFDVAFSPDGKRVATVGGDGNVRVWEVGSAKEILLLPIESAGNTEDFRSVAFSPDGKHIVAAGLASPSIRVWDATTGELLPSDEPDNSGLFDLAFSPNGKLAAAGGMDQKAFVWDTATGHVMFTLSGHTNPIHSVAFNPDGTRLATASWDHTVRVWDLTSAKESLFIPINYGPMYINYSPDGSRLLTSYSEQKASGKYQIKIWDADSGKELVALKEGQEQASSIFGLDSFSSDGKLVAGNNGQNIVIWNAKNGNQKTTLSGHTGSVTALDFSPDGRHLVSGSDHGELLIWDLASGKVTLPPQWSTDWTPHAGYTLFGLNYSPDGKKIVLGDSRGDGFILDATTGEKLYTLADENSIAESSYGPGTIYSAAYSPDGTRVVFGHSLGTVRVWSTLTGKEMLTLKGHTRPVLSVKFSPDGKLIATSSLDGTTRIWDAVTGENLLMLPVAGGLSFRPDGKRLAIGSESGVYIFVVSIDDLLSLAKSRVTRSLTREECQQYLHVRTCPSQ